MVIFNFDEGQVTQNNWHCGTEHLKISKKGQIWESCLIQTSEKIPEFIELSISSLF